jgi:hypothetical protein
MTFLLVLPTILALLTLGAHYLRYGLVPMALLLVVLGSLLLIDKRWVARLMQGVLLLAALEWILVLRSVIQERVVDGRPYRKSVFILGGTAAFTLLAAGLYQTPRLKRRYSPNGLRAATDDAETTTLRPARLPS